MQVMGDAEGEQIARMERYGLGCAPSFQSCAGSRVCTRFVFGFQIRIVSHISNSTRVVFVWDQSLQRAYSKCSLDLRKDDHADSDDNLHLFSFAAPV